MGILHIINTFTNFLPKRCDISEFLKIIPTLRKYIPCLMGNSLVKPFDFGGHINVDGGPEDKESSSSELDGVADSRVSDFI